MPRRPGLDRQIVVEAAADLVNGAGLDALTLSRLAGVLGVKIPSLYNHVDGLPGLRRELTLLSTRRLGERLQQAAAGKRGNQALEAIAHAYRAFVKQEPGLYQAGVRSAVFQADAELDEAQGAVLDVVLDVLLSADIPAARAVHAARGLRSLAHGFATLETAGGFGLPEDCDESFRQLVAVFLAGLDAYRQSS